MKKVEILCILDRSGSMDHIMKEAINAFNEFVTEQKTLPGDARLTLAAFDDKYDVIHDRVDIQEVPTLSKRVVFARGMTALNDAIGKTINNAKKNKKTICLIQTDGLENCSNEYSTNDIRELIKKKTKKGWEFHFIGAGIDAFAEGHKYGIPDANRVSVASNAKGMSQYGATCNAATTSFRSG